MSTSKYAQQLMDGTANSNFEALQGNTVVDMDTVTGIDIADGWTEISYIDETDPVMITDASMSANKDGTFRFCMEGDSIKHIYYTAKTYIQICRNLPYFIPEGYKMSIEFLASEDNTDVSCCIGGIKNG